MKQMVVIDTRPEALTMDNIREVIYQAAKREVDLWFIAQCADPYNSFYLYFKRSQPNTWGALRIALECPPDYELVMSSRIPVNFTKDQVIHLITEACRRLPILPY